MSVNFQSNVIPPGTIQGVYNAPASVPTLTDGVGAVPRLDPSAKMVVAVEAYKRATYRAAGVGLTLYSAAAAVLVEIQGSATKIVLVKKITIWGQAGTKFYTELELLRSTTVAATGTPVVAVLGQHDTADVAATAVVNSYAAAATYGTGHILIGAAPLMLSAPSAAVVLNPTVWDFCRNMDRPVILRGVADVLQVYNTILTLGSGTFGFEIEWEEE
ncbi:MAG: hypothetical protein ABSG91_07065 [Syntrophobacteraceae bacterium]|jgi:hypothetical protein